MIERKIWLMSFLAASIVTCTSVSAFASDNIQLEVIVKQAPQTTTTFGINEQSVSKIAEWHLKQKDYQAVKFKVKKGHKLLIMIHVGGRDLNNGSAVGYYAMSAVAMSSGKSDVSKTQEVGYNRTLNSSLYSGDFNFVGKSLGTDLEKDLATYISSNAF
jgi:hypothetical protein